MGGEDRLDQTVPWLFVLGGGVAGERDQLACQLYAQGNGRSGVVLTGGNREAFLSDRAAFLRDCGVPNTILMQWPDNSNTYAEMSAIKRFLLANSTVHALVVSDALHMTRLRYVRSRLALDRRVIFRQSHLGARQDLVYLSHVVEFWFREPLAYIYYRIRY